VLDYEAHDKGSDLDSTLTEIMHLVDVQPGVTSEGWNRETARMYAIDVAMMVLRRHLLALTEVHRQTLTYQLQEARSLVMSGRDGEIGFIQAALESHLSLAQSTEERRLWLTAIDAFLPSPFRAALVSTRNALALGGSELAGFADQLRERLLARLGEGSLHTESGPSLFLTA